MRSPRLAPADVAFHVLNRAAGRRQIFIDDADYAQFEAVLDESLRKFNVELAAYCVMPNHFHLLAMPREDGTLSRWLAWLQATHAKRWHAARTSQPGTRSVLYRRVCEWRRLPGPRRTSPSIRARLTNPAGEPRRPP